MRTLTEKIYALKNLYYILLRVLLKTDRIDTGATYGGTVGSGLTPGSLPGVHFSRLSVPDPENLEKPEILKKASDLSNGGLKKFSLCLNSKSMREKREGEKGKTQ